MIIIYLFAVRGVYGTTIKKYLIVIIIICTEAIMKKKMSSRSLQADRFLHRVRLLNSCVMLIVIAVSCLFCSSVLVR